MKKRILSILLILCMVLSMLPLSAFATGTANHLTVLETAPATATVTAGSLYELDLSTVFADTEGHTLTYALSGGDFGEHTKIADGKLAFTVSTAGEYKPTITAACSEGESVSHTVTVTVTEAAEGSDRQYGYDETPASSVTVYVTISNDGMPILSSNDTDTVMAGLKVTVPYFDLKLYGLEDYYRYHTEDGQGSYVDDVIVERPTALHLYIYLLERYYMGLPEKDCCKGTSGVLGYAEDTAVSYFDGTGAYSSGTLQAADFNGSATSFFMNNFWGHDLNLKYYRNHAYPLMYAGWGSTADYILLSDGDAIDIGLFSNWNFYNEGEFCCFDADAYTGEAGSTLTAKLLRWNADESDLEAFADLSVALYDSDWNKVTELTKPESGNIFTLTLPETAGEYYLLGMDLNAATENAANSPAVARITVTGTEPEPEEPSVQGYLSDLRFTASSGATSQLYALAPAFTEDNLIYTMQAPDSRSGAYAWATLSENAPEGSTITAKWAGTNGQERSITITSGKTTGQWMAYFLDAGTHVNSVTVEVGVEGDLQTYEVQVIRVQPTLTELSLEGIRFNESFSATTFAYTTATMADSVTIHATPRDESYTVTYNGSESNVVALTDGENSISVKVVNEGSYESVYTITVNKVAPISIRFDVTPADAVVNLQDSFGDRIWPEDGIYTLMSGCTYSYTVTKNGYIGQKNNFTLTESGTIEIELEEAPENAAIDTTIYAQWGVFRGENNLGITDAKTPYTPEDAEVLWAAKFGTGWAAAPNPPIMVDGDLIVIVGSSIKRLDRNTGEIKVEGTMAGTCGFGIITPTYGDGMIFVPLSGKLQAFNAETLESLWVYTDPLGGQPNCTVAYEDGYAYVGWWGSETKNANFACVSVTDEDPTSTNEAKLSTWTYTRAGGFYWAGAYTTDKYVLVGTDDGQSGYSSETASLLIFDRFTGELLDSQDGIRGDIRSNISYDPSSDRVFFTSKGGVLCNAKIDWSTGKITDFKQVVLKDSKGNEYAMSTCTPCVYNDRIYIGVAGTSQFGDFSGHGISVFDLNEDGSMTNAYVYDIKGYPQSSAMVTTAYADEQDGYVYIYQTYNTTPGGISVLKDKKGQTEPITTTDAGYSEVFTPVTPLSQYCLASVIADEYGTIYYKNDSCYTIALTSKIESIEVTKIPTALTENGDGTWSAEGLEVVVNLKNGSQRDVTDYVTITDSEQEDYLTVSYTYGLDHENYGLTTLTAELSKSLEPPVQGYLSDLRFAASSGATSQLFEMSPAFTEENLTYTMLVPDNRSGAYAWATLSENAPEGSTITAKWAGTNGQDRSITITSGKTTGQWMAYFLDAGTHVNSVTVEVGVEGDLQTYEVQVVRVQPTLTELSLEGIRFNESFSATTFAYTTATMADSVTINAVPRDESYTVTYNGSESNVVALTDGENNISVKVVNEGGYESVYTITVNKVAPISIRFDVTPADAVVNLQDSFGDRIWPEDGIYTLMSGCTYSYTVTKNGYIGQKNNFTLTESGTIEIELEEAPENAAIDTTIYAQWGVFRGENNLGITDAPTPYTPEDAEVLWAAKWGTGWAAAPNPPIMVDGDLIVIVGSSIKRVDRNTGEVKVEGTMAGTCGFGIITPTYGDGMIFVPLSGKLQAFNAETLESLWVYTDPLGGQPNCTVAYEDGYAYVGWWGSETKNANFACASVTDEDPTSTNEAKLATWTYTRAGGFYWAGAYTTDKYVLVGTDDGQSGYSSESASLLIFDRFTGKLLDSQDGIRGDIRSNISYDPSSDRVFFTSKGGVLCNAKIDWATGKITDFKQVVLKDSKGNEYAMSTCTPCVYNDRIYIGVAGTSQFGDFSGHGISVFDLNEDGSMTNAYVYDIKGYPQSSAMVTTAYADEQDGYVYIYQTYNTTPGGISVLKDKKGQTEPITTTDAGYSEVFTPVTPLSQYCLASVIADEYGTIYYKNDSCYTIALTSKIESIEITQTPTSYTRNEDGTWTAEGLKIVANLKNGLQRDVTDYIVISESAETNGLVASYTYGLDHENYGLKTLSIDLCSLCTALGHDYTVTMVSATCDTDGYNLHTCTRCGYNYRDQFAPALGHSYEDTVTAPTHDKMGYTTHTCAVCGLSYVDSYTDALGHDYTGEITREATCTVEGEITFTCTCGESYTQAIPVIAHEYETSVTAPSCTEAGYTTHTCKVCGFSYVDSVVAALGHSYEAAVTAPTCTEQGYTTHTCAVCDHSYIDSVVPATGHDYEAAVTAPTCTEAGYTTHTCKVCGHSYVDSVVPATGHDYEAAVTAPTCTEAGYTTHTCKACGHSYVDSVIPAVGHDFEASVTAPTHDKMGYTTHTCKTCGYSYVASYTDALGHAYTSEVTKEPTCTEEGEMTFTCTCGESYTQAIPVIAHEYEATVTAPTCTEMGFTTYTCKHCGCSYVAEYINATGHDFALTVVTPTCTAYGYTSAVCSDCGYSMICSIAQPLGHNHVLVNQKEASCTEEGYTGDMICERCGDVQSQGKTIPVTFDDCPTASFTDLDTGAWYHEATDFVLRSGYMLGASETEFAPDESLTRGQLVTILYRVSGSPAVSAACPFKDVAENSYYRDAIVWAYVNGIALGVSAGKFAPDEAVTREQMVTFFARYATKNGANVSDGADLSAYKDGAKVSTYAAEAMAWAVKNGIVNGVSADMLDPQGTATRVQAAAIVQRLCALLAA